MKLFFLRFVIFKLGLFFCVFTTVSCSSNKVILTEPISQQFSPIKEGKINYTFTPQSQIIVKQDVAKINSIVIKNGPNLVLKFEYIKKPTKNTVDSGYREVLYIEIPNKKQSINLSDLNQSDINIWFARFCFCRDYVGFHKITEGALQIDLSAKALKIKLEIKFNNLPQVLNFIDQNISLNKTN